MRREYTRALIRDFAPGLRRDAGRLGAARRVSPRPQLRGAAGRRMPPSRPRSRPVSSTATAGAPIPSCSPARIIRCCSTASQRLAPWPVAWIDPAPAIARRVVDLIGPAAAGRHRRAGRSRCSRPAVRRRAGAGSGACRLRIYGDGRQRRRFDKRPALPLETAGPQAFSARVAFRDPWLGLGALGPRLSVPAEIRDRGGRDSSTTQSSRPDSPPQLRTR